MGVQYVTWDYFKPKCEIGLAAMQMGACAPIWIMRTAIQAYAAFAFLPVSLPINGQNNRTKAKVVMVPTK